MYVVKTFSPRGRWEVARKFWAYADAYAYALDLRYDGYDVRIEED